MTKKTAATTAGVVELISDAEKLAALRPNVATQVPVIPPQDTVETPVKVPTVTSQDILAALDSNPELFRAIIEKLTPPAAPKTRQAYNAGSVSAVPTVRKSSQKAGFVEFMFSEKPDEATRTELKGAGFRWSKHNSVWYGPANALANHNRFGADVRAAIGQ